MLKNNLEYNSKVESNTSFINELKEKLPEFFTPDKFDEDGNIVSKGNFDLEKFKNALSVNIIQTELTSGYQLNFIGKEYAKKQTGEVPTTVLLPDKIHNNKLENITSDNIFFTGDNLEVLRHLSTSYSSSFDVIYVDPPYNTGTDRFVYPDKFEYSDEKLKVMFGMNDDELKRFKSIQGTATHSAWLTFMYPRLWLAKRLLKDTGVIFISIDDNEQANLKLIMDEIFGEGQFIGNISWESKTKSQNTKTSFDKLQPKTEHIFVYTRQSHSHFNLIKSGDKEYNYSDKNGKYREYVLETMSSDGVRGRETMIFPILGILPPDGQQWKLGKETIELYKKRDDIEERDGKIIIKIRPSDENTEKFLPFWGFFSKEIGTAETAKAYLNSLMGEKELFDTVKPVELIKRLLFHSSNKDSLVLDLFAGSATTAEAVMLLNLEDGGERKYVLVQLPEPTFLKKNDGTKVALKGAEAPFKAGYMTIDEISRKRIQLARERIKKDLGNTLPKNFDGGFKHYRVVQANQATLNDLDNFDIETGMFVDSKGYQIHFLESGFDDMITPFSSQKLGFGEGATGEETILVSWLLSDGYPLSIKSEPIDIEGYKANYVNLERLYLISTGWSSEQTKNLINLIGSNKMAVQTIVLYSYSFEMESMRELELALNQLDTKINLIKRY